MSVKQLDPAINYLIFDQSKLTPATPNQLNLTQPSVLSGIQSLLLNEILPRYSFNDYTKTPRGPLAILLLSADMPGTLNYVRDKLNSLIFQSNIDAENSLNAVLSSRVEQLLQNALVDSGGKANAQEINRLKAKVTEFKRVSSDLWKFDAVKIIDGVDRSLEYLKKTVDSLKGNWKFLKQG